MANRTNHKNGKKFRREMSPKHMAMIDRYFENGFNQTEAAAFVGFKHANGYTARLFTRKDVKAEIDRRRKAHAKKHEVTREYLIERYKRIVEAGDRLAKYKHVSPDGAVYWDFTDIEDEDRGLIRGIKTKYYTEGRGDAAREVKEFTPDVGSVGEEKGALDSLARMIGAFEDKTKLEAGDEILELLRAGRARIKKDDGQS